MEGTTERCRTIRQSSFAVIMFSICHVDKLLSEAEASISSYVIKTSRQTLNFFSDSDKDNSGFSTGLFLGGDMHLKLPEIPLRKLQHKMLYANAKITFPLCQDYAGCFVFLKEKCFPHMIVVTGQSLMSSFAQPVISF